MIPIAGGIAIAESEIEEPDIPDDGPDQHPHPVLVGTEPVEDVRGQQDAEDQEPHAS